MAINFLNTVDLNQNQLDHARIVNEAGNVAAGTGVAGQLYFDTTADAGVGVLKVWTDQWVEVGGGVESLTNTSGTYVAFGTDNVSATGAVTLGTVDLTAVDGTSVLATRFLSKDNTWDVPAFDNYSGWILDGDSGIAQTISSGNTALFTGGTKITTAVAATDVLTITHDAQAQTDTTSTAAPGYLGTFTAIDTVSRDSTGHVTGVNVKTITIPASDDTTYDLTTALTGTAVRLTDGVTPDDVTISGTAGRTAMSRISASELRVNLTDDVTIINDLTVGNDLTLTGGNLDVTGTGSFTGEVTVPTATTGTSAPNLAQVELLVAGVGVFQGSYNAATNTPALEGASNVALDQGDYFVVSVSGTFLGEALEPGDFIFANNAIAANSTPALSNYTVVQADDNIAGAGATDGATQKGVSGFDSENFTVSSNGWVQLKPLANPYGTSVTLTSGVDAGGETTFTVDVTALFGATASAANCKAEVLRVSDLGTVYPEVSRNGTGDILFKFVPVVADSAFKALITIV
jgi:hypothetical protein